VTRINLVDPALLSDAHLGAEYRELPRVFGLVQRAQQRGKVPADYRKEGDRYTLGTGHVLFFYTRLAWVEARHQWLVAECRARHRLVAYPSVAQFRELLHPGWYGAWCPRPEEVALSVKRIEERGGLRRIETAN
jgi:deoxyribonuclease (pyrimidine dimer)